MDAMGCAHVPLCIGRQATSPPTKQEAVMRGVAMKTILAAAIAGSSLLVATQASAHDYDRWDRWEHKHHWKHSRGYGPPERVIVARPVYVAAPRPGYAAPAEPLGAVGPGQRS